MNDLARLSDVELDRQIAEIREREKEARTEKGQRLIKSKMHECVKFLVEANYKLEGTEETMTRLWLDAFTDDFVRLGEVKFKNAVENYVLEDDRDFKTFPPFPAIKKECEKMGGNPRAEKGRREQARREQALEEESAREFREWKESHPEEARRIEERARKCICG